MSKEIYRILSLFCIVLVTLFLSACGGGTSSTSVDSTILKAKGIWNPYFGGEEFLIDVNGDYIGQTIIYEEKLNDDGTVDLDADDSKTFIFNSLGEVYLSIEILGDPIEIGNYDINSAGTELIIESLKTKYELFENKVNNCFKVNRYTNDIFDGYYNLCYKFD